MCAHPMLESGSSSLKLSAIVVDRAMRGSFFCRAGQGRAAPAVSASARPRLQASLHPLTVCPSGAGPHRGPGRGQGSREARRATATGESGSRTMTRHGGGDLFLGPC